MEKNGFSWDVSLCYALERGISGEIRWFGVNILTGAGIGEWGATTNILSGCMILWSHRKYLKKVRHESR